MEKETHAIEHEKRLVELLGYNLLGPDNSNRWLIEDEQHNQVGFVQYKKVFNKNMKKGIPAGYGYHTEIESRDIHYNATRKENDLNAIFQYEFDIKRKNGNADHLEFNVGKYPNLTLWSTQYGFMNFRIDTNGFFLNFKSKTESFNVEETVVYQTHDRKYSHLPNEYTYQINYCNKDIDLTNDYAKGIKGRSITGKCTPEQQANNEVQITENTWTDNRLVTNRETMVTGTLEEMIEKHEMGRDAFSHFRFLINQILPFKQEVVSFMLEKNSCENLSLFLPELEKEPRFVKKTRKKYNKQINLQS